MEWKIGSLLTGQREQVREGNLELPQSHLKCLQMWRQGFTILCSCSAFHARQAKDDDDVHAQQAPTSLCIVHRVCVHHGSADYRLGTLHQAQTAPDHHHHHHLLHCCCMCHKHKGPGGTHNPVYKCVYWEVFKIVFTPGKSKIKYCFTSNKYYKGCRFVY